MTIQLPEDLERFVRSQVLSGHFTSENEAITEAVRLLRQRKQEQEGQAIPLSEEEFERQLVTSGFLGGTPPRNSTATSQRDFQPIRIEGEPLSETVIRERR
jgi:putative addiction module CopG family antidote